MDNTQRNAEARELAKQIEIDNGMRESSTDPLAGFPLDYPCRACAQGAPENFHVGSERCDDQPCEELKEWKSKESTKGDGLSDIREGQL